MFDRLRKFGFTRQDLIIIVFLIVTFASGLIIKLWGWQKPDSFNYASEDSRFEQQLKESFSELPKLNATQSSKLELIRNISDSLTASKDSREKEELKEKFAKKININLAYSADLQRLPGIGEVMAERIVEFREQNGNFKNIEDIMLVKGIGIKKFEKIKDLITAE